MSLVEQDEMIPLFVIEDMVSQCSCRALTCPRGEPFNSIHYHGSDAVNSQLTNLQTPGQDTGMALRSPHQRVP